MIKNKKRLNESLLNMVYYESLTVDLLIWYVDLPIWSVNLLIDWSYLIIFLYFGELANFYFIGSFKESSSLLAMKVVHSFYNSISKSWDGLIEFNANEEAICNMNDLSDIPDFPPGSIF